MTCWLKLIRFLLSIIKKPFLRTIMDEWVTDGRYNVDNSELCIEGQGSTFLSRPVVGPWFGPVNNFLFDRCVDPSLRNHMW